MKNRLLVATLFSAGLCVGCGPETPTPMGSCEESFEPGDLVITEVMANPSGQDEGNEWFEIFNTRGQALSLDGMVITLSAADGDSAKSHVIAGGAIDGDGFMVLQGVVAQFAPDYVDYGYESDLGRMGNGGGRISLRCGEQIIDEAVYADAPDGASLVIGAIDQAFELNNDPLNWCASTNDTFDSSGNFGTPGLPNGTCDLVKPGFCMDGDNERTVTKPGPGDLVITEFLANPDVVGDAEGEWFEIKVNTDVDLNFLEIGKEVADGVKDTVLSSQCLPVSAGTYVVAARADTANGGLPVVDILHSVSLNNSNGALFIGYEGEVIDAITWGSTSTGTSKQVDPGFTDASENDNTGYWCNGTSVYGDGDLGTPGAVNANCDNIEPPEGMCSDGGVLRPIDPPTAGELGIVEVMANPAAVSDSVGEWFELEATGTFDLNGVGVGNSDANADATFGGIDCIAVSPGDRFVMARESDPLINGGLPQVDGLFSFGLTNGGITLYLFDAAGNLMNSTAYPAAATGASSVYDTGTTSWCTSTTPYGDGDLGTPGTGNPSCS